MSTLTVTRNYLDGDNLTQAQLDEAFDSIEISVNGNLDSTNLAAGGITAVNLAASSVTNGKIAALAVGTAALQDAAVTTAKIADGAIATAELADGAVTTAKLADANVTGAKLAASTVGKANLAALGEQKSSSCGAYATASNFFTTVTNLSVSLTTSGNRPVMLIVQPDGSGNTAFWSTAGNNEMFYQFRQDSTSLGASVLAYLTSSSIPSVGGPPIHFFVSTPSAGSHTYDFQIKSGNAGISFEYFVLIAYEIG